MSYLSTNTYKFRDLDHLSKFINDARNSVKSIILIKDNVVLYVVHDLASSRKYQTCKLWKKVFHVIKAVNLFNRACTNFKEQLLVQAMKYCHEYVPLEHKTGIISTPHGNKYNIMAHTAKDNKIYSYLGRTVDTPTYSKVTAASEYGSGRQDSVSGKRELVYNGGNNNHITEEIAQLEIDNCYHPEDHGRGGHIHRYDEEISTKVRSMRAVMHNTHGNFDNLKYEVFVPCLIQCSFGTFDTNGSKKAMCGHYSYDQYQYKKSWYRIYTELIYIPVEQDVVDKIRSDTVFLDRSEKWLGSYNAHVRKTPPSEWKAVNVCSNDHPHFLPPHRMQYIMILECGLEQGHIDDNFYCSYNKEQLTGKEEYSKIKKTLKTLVDEYNKNKSIIDQVELLFKTLRDKISSIIEDDGSYYGYYVFTRIIQLLSNWMIRYNNKSIGDKLLTLVNNEQDNIIAGNETLVMLFGSGASSGIYKRPSECKRFLPVKCYDHTLRNNIDINNYILKIKEYFTTFPDTEIKYLLNELTLDSNNCYPQLLSTKTSPCSPIIDKHIEEHIGYSKEYLEHMKLEKTKKEIIHLESAMKIAVTSARFDTAHELQVKIEMLKESIKC